MQIFSVEAFALPLPPGHRFPMTKYALLCSRLISEGIVRPDQICTPRPVAEEDLSRVHDAGYVERVRTGALSPREQRSIGLPWSPMLWERARRSVGGTLAAARSALETGVGLSLAGGTHHAFRDRGAGYCVFNDVAVAARALQSRRGALRVVILDCDVHQGDGTASLFAGDPTVFTFSIHGARNYPARKVPGDLDVALDDGTGDESYLEALESGVGRALEASGADLAIYLAGADPLKDDRLGRLALSKGGLAERDRSIFRLCRERGVPVAVTLAGGYADPIGHTVDVHTQTVRIACGYAAKSARDG